MFFNTFYFQLKIFFLNINFFSNSENSHSSPHIYLLPHRISTSTEFTIFKNTKEKLSWRNTKFPPARHTIINWASVAINMCPYWQNLHNFKHIRYLTILGCSRFTSCFKSDISLMAAIGIPASRLRPCLHMRICLTATSDPSLLVSRALNTCPYAPVGGQNKTDIRHNWLNIRSMIICKIIFFLTHF